MVGGDRPAGAGAQRRQRAGGGCPDAPARGGGGDRHDLPDHSGLWGGAARAPDRPDPGVRAGPDPAAAAVTDQNTSIAPGGTAQPNPALAGPTTPAPSSRTRPPAASAANGATPRYAAPRSVMPQARSAGASVGAQWAWAGAPVSRHRPVWAGSSGSVTSSTTSTGSW